MLGMSSLGLAGTIGDGSLSILSPNGSALTQFAANSGSDSGAGFDATFTFTAATSGNYTFSISGVGALTGSYVLQAGVVGGAAMTQANTYTVNNAATGVIENVGGFGVDVVKASVSYALSQSSEIEVLRTSNDKGKTAINLTGNEFGQQIIGNAAANVLEGKAGADTFTGLGGKDVFVLSKAAVDAPGAANIDRITDYASGDVVDVTQILKVAAGTNVISGGWLRVTADKVQVDMDGGADNWVTLSTINGGTSSVAVRYVSGGVVTNISVGRTAESGVRSMTAANGNSVLVGALAAAGMMAAPAAAHDSVIADGGVFVGGQALASHLSSMTGTEAFVRSALSGETREAVDAGAAQSAHNSVTAHAVPVSEALVTKVAAPGPAVTELPRGTDVPAQAEVTLVTEAVLMPAVAAPVAIAVAGEASANAEVGRILAEALSGGGGNPLDALLDALPGNAQSEVIALGWHAGHMPAFASAHVAVGLDALAFHLDAPPLA
jgi:hypothetical protein